MSLLSDDVCMPGVDQREARAAPKLVLVFLLRKVFVFVFGFARLIGACF